jgi:hypothetical protein
MEPENFQRDFITIVSGLPRSGTSMMMKMLAAGGIPPLTDGERTADEDNPEGYFEFEAVKKLKEDATWIPRARGKVVKVISELLYDLPPGETYRVLFLRRHIAEILSSQEKMLRRRGTFREDGPGDEVIGPLLEKSALRAMTHVAENTDMRMLVVDYNEIFGKVEEVVAKIDEFLGGGLDREAMGGVVNPGLYRQRLK